MTKPRSDYLSGEEYLKNYRVVKHYIEEILNKTHVFITPDLFSEKMEKGIYEFHYVQLRKD